MAETIDESDTRKMTADERAYFARVTAANAKAVKAEQKRIDAVKTLAIQKSLNRGKLTIEEIAENNTVSIDFVLEVQRGLTQNQ